jgi:spore coat protein JB
MIDYNVVCENNLANMTQEQLLCTIQSYNFAITDLAEYLDTHNNDAKAIALHNQYCKDYRNFVDYYERMYGPLTIFYPTNTWRWRTDSWPWEGGNY